VLKNAIVVLASLLPAAAWAFLKPGSRYSPIHSWISETTK